MNVALQQQSSLQQPDTCAAVQNACSAITIACRLELMQASPTTSTWVPSWRSTCSSGVSATVAAELLLRPLVLHRAACAHVHLVTCCSSLEAVEPVCVLIHCWIWAAAASSCSLYDPVSPVCKPV